MKKWLTHWLKSSDQCQALITILHDSGVMQESRCTRNLFIIWICRNLVRKEPLHTKSSHRAWLECGQTGDHPPLSRPYSTSSISSWISLFHQKTNTFRTPLISQPKCSLSSQIVSSAWPGTSLGTPPPPSTWGGSAPWGRACPAWPPPPTWSAPGSSSSSSWSPSSRSWPGSSSRWDPSPGQTGTPGQRRLPHTWSGRRISSSASWYNEIHWVRWDDDAWISENNLHMCQSPKA